MAALPDVPGPKLLPFDFDERRDDFELVKFLGKGVHAFVWKVKIKQKEYALKIFPFWLHDEPPVQGLRVTENESLAYFDPFFCECRAYGRLKECGIEEYAVKCHGYILLGGKLQQELKEKDHHDWEEDWGWTKGLAGEPLRSLVKDLVDADFDAIDKDDSLDYEDYLDQRTLMNLDRQSGTRLVRGVKLIHRNGIVVRDIHNTNIAHGKILDFSLAWTAPHPCFTPEMLHANRYRLALHRLSYADACAIDVLIEEWNERFGHKHKAGPIRDRLLQNTYYLERLRPRKNPLSRREYGVRYRGEMYGWSASQKKRWKELCRQRES